MFRKSLVLGLVAMATFAFAIECNVDGVHGFGVAGTEDRHGEFRLAAKRVTCGDRSQIDGHFVFRTVNRDRRAAIEITMVRLGRLGVGEDTAEWTGHGTMVVRTPQGVRRTTGAIQGRAHDAGEGDDPDYLGFTFTPERGEPYAFRGPVVRGNIEVFHRTFSR
ncbi:MAG: hypothetical protein HUU60_00350 [Armatimonadetes bacterium]|nr:hypothetical protein [Armatimonadota bacterium]